MELQAQDLEKMTMCNSDSSEEEDDNEETCDMEYYEDYSPDLLGDLELKDLDDDTRNLLSSIFFSDEYETTQTIALSQQKFEDDQSVCNVDTDRGNEEDEDDIDSEEERNILQDIKEEIENKVREEMKEELEDFHSRIKALESGIIADVKTDEEMDPKLKEAIVKMNKLDKILKKKVKQEKEVKRTRLLLERRLHREICELTQGGSFVREVKLNTEKFLALELPQSHNEGVKLDYIDQELPPVFQTQIEENLLQQSKSAVQKPSSSSNINNHGKSTSTSSFSSARNKGRSITRVFNRQSKKSKDFIERNKKLASQADEPVAMTDDEKKRLKELLVGIDDLPDLGDSLEDTTEIDESPLQIYHHQGEGYCPDNMEKMNLVNIHEKLKQIMPEEEYKSIFSTSDMVSGHVTPQHPVFTRVGVQLFTNVDPKEQALIVTKEERELNSRLLSIEKELENFKVSQEMEDDLAKHLTDEQLDKLLDECVSNLSRTSNFNTPNSTHRSHLSSRQHFLENPPKLTEEQLQQLLSEAHFPISSKLLALREHDGQTENDDGYFETITADTWKAIKEAQPIISEDTEDRIINATTTNKKTKISYNTSEQELCSLNKNMSANNNDNQPHKSSISDSYKYNFRSDARDYLFSSVAVMSVDSMNNSIQQSYSDLACWKSSEDMKRFPEISKSCIYFTAENSRGNTSSSLSQENSDNELNTLHLPLLSSSSFLIHAQQGLSTEDTKEKK